MTTQPKIDTFFTRKEYLAGHCTHDQYYQQFITGAAHSHLLRVIDQEKIVNSTDPHFNDIPLREWDALPDIAPRALLEKAGDTLTLAGKVCIYKAIAKQIRREYAPPRRWTLQVKYREVGDSCGSASFPTDITGTVDGILDYYTQGPINMGDGAGGDRMARVINIEFEEKEA